MENRVLVTGGTKDDTAPIATFIINVKKTNAHLFNKVIVFHDGIKKKDQNIIKEIMDVEFRLYNPPFSTNNGMVFSYFSPMVFCKYECIRLLDEYDEVVWSDYDVIIRKKLDDIVKFENDVFWNITTSQAVILGGKLNQDIICDDIKLNYDMDRQGVCAALFTLRKGIGNSEELTEWCYEHTEKYDKNLYLPEEAIFSMMIQEFGIRYSQLDMNIYASPARENDENAIILHAVGIWKFWNSISNPVWDANYEEWLSMGGSKYSDSKKKMNRNIRLIKSKILRIISSVSIT